MKISVRVFALLLCAFFVSCSSDKVAGTATDTENTIAGTVLLSDGSMANGVVVRQVVAARMANMAAYLETETDSLGVFAFDSALADTVSVEFRYRAQDASQNVAISQAQIVRGVSLKNTDKLNVKLQKTAVLRGQLENAGSASSLVGSHFILGLDSTTFSVDVFAPDSFELVLPEGGYSLSIFPADSGVVSKLQNSGYADSTIIRKIPVTVSAGDTLDVGNLRWNASEEEPTQTKLLLGTVKMPNGKPAKGVSVHVVTDLYGFGVTDSAAFVTQAVSDSLGVWRVPAPVLDSVNGQFRVEFRVKELTGAVLAGVSDYINKSELEKASDTLMVNEVVLEKASNLRGSVFLVVNLPATSKPDTLCWAYGIRVGIFGTSNFKTVSSCDRVEILNLPSDFGEAQKLVFYSGDEMVVQKLKNGELEVDDYVQSVSVNIKSGDTLDNQNITYSPPFSAYTTEKDVK